MADVFDSAKRSKIMRSIQSKDTSPELKIRKALHAQGYRFRLHDNTLPGCPDLVLPKYKAVIQVRGCFWHQHEGCKKSRIPKTKVEYWEIKLKRNIMRDLEADRKLADIGWTVLVVWECEIRGQDKLKAMVESLAQKLQSAILSD